MARRPKSAKQTLADLVDGWTEEIRTAFLAAIRDITDNVILEQVIAAIKRGDLEGAFTALQMSDAAMRPITAAIERAFEAGGAAIGQTFPKSLRTNEGVRGVFRFDVRDSRAEAWIREESSRLITAISEGTRVAVRNIGFEGIRDGRNPRSIALDIVGRFDPVTKSRTGGVIGLTSNQERWVANTRTHLEGMNATIRNSYGKIPFEKYIAKIESNPYFSRELREMGADRVIMKLAREGKPIDPETVNRLVSKYKSNALRYRGEVIGRTEALNSLRASNREAFLQAVDMGATKASAVKRVWDATGDKRTREDHMEMDGQTVGLNEPFRAPDGSLLMYPGDGSLGADPSQVIQCRCVERYDIDWYADLT